MRYPGFAVPLMFASNLLKGMIMCNINVKIHFGFNNLGWQVEVKAFKKFVFTALTVQNMCDNPLHHKYTGDVVLAIHICKRMH